MKKTITNSLFVLILLTAILYLIAWKSPKYYTVQTAYQPADSIVPFQQYTGEHERPYLIVQKNLVIFGATHTRDANDPQMARMQEAWSELQPTVALVEGRLGFLIPYIMDPVKELGEGGMVKALAHRDGATIYNWDLSKETLAKSLQSYFQPEQIALYQILNPYFSNLRFGKPADPEKYIRAYLNRAAYVGLGDRINNTSEVDRIWSKYFPQGPNWRDVSDETTLPGYLNQLMAVTNDLRNQQLVTAVKELTKKGERVFVVCGSSHAYCVRTAFQ